MSLFAITDIEGAKILRFNLNQQFQAEVLQSFEDQYHKFISGIDEYHQFDGRYTPQEGELLCIDDFQDLEGMAAAAASPLKISIFEIKNHSLARIKALFVVRKIKQNDFILIQLFEKRRVLSAEASALKMVFSGNAFQKFENEGIALDNKLLAIFDIATKRISFQSFHFLSRALDVSKYFVQATDEDVKSFTQHATLEVKDSARFLAGATKLQRKKIALILQSGILEKFTAQELEQVAQTVSMTITLSADGKIVMPEKPADIRKLLSFLEEDYYKSPLTQTLYLAGSKRVAT